MTSQLCLARCNLGVTPNCTPEGTPRMVCGRSFFSCSCSSPLPTESGQLKQEESAVFLSSIVNNNQTCPACQPRQLSTVLLLTLLTFALHTCARGGPALNSVDISCPVEASVDHIMELMMLKPSQYVSGGAILCVRSWTSRSVRSWV